MGEGVLYRAAPEKVRFAIDSPVEGDGFELSLPGHRELCWRGPPLPACEGLGAVQRDFFCSACHCIEPGCHTVWAGCGWRRWSAGMLSRSECPAILALCRCSRPLMAIT
jgi:hypothetical protein